MMPIWCDGLVCSCLRRSPKQDIILRLESAIHVITHAMQDKYTKCQEYMTLAIQHFA
jgi:hypothetical protein